MSRPPFPYLIGADPELFLVDKKGKFRSAHTVLTGTKEYPVIIPGGATQVDGVAAEFNVDPTSNVDEFCKNIRLVLRQLNDTIKKADENLSLRVVPTAVFDGRYFKHLPPEAQAFGCSPDYSAYTGEQQEFEGTTKPFRTGAGHIHIGWTSGEKPFDTAHMYDCTQMVRQLDASLYFMSKLWDKDETRRTLYGRIGSFRPKQYGVEYRPLSNAWVADPDLHRYVFEFTTRAAQLHDEDKMFFDRPFIRDFVERERKGESIEHRELVNLHNFFTSTMFEFPALPKAYLEA